MRSLYPYGQSSLVPTKGIGTLELVAKNIWNCQGIVTKGHAVVPALDVRPVLGPRLSCYQLKFLLWGKPYRHRKKSICIKPGLPGSQVELGTTRGPMAWAVLQHLDSRFHGNDRMAAKRLMAWLPFRSPSYVPM